MQKILVTGASGFLGKNLISKILKNKNFVIYALTHSKNYEFKDKKNLLLIDCDITNSKKLKKKLNLNFDYVVNFAGNINHKNKKETYDAHFKGLKNIINSINLDKLKLFIQIGSSLEYGNAKSPHFESQACNPMSHYGKSKFLATKLIKQKIKKYIILRLYQVYGPFQKKNRLIPITINSCLKNNSFACSEGNQMRDFLYVNDFIKLILKILNKKNVKKGIYNVGSGKSIKIKTIIEKIKKKIKKGKPLFGKIKMRKEEVINSYPNISKIRKAFNWKPTTELEKGLIKTIKSYAK